MIEFQPMTMIFISYDYLLLQIMTSFDFQCRQNLNLKILNLLFNNKKFYSLS